MLKSALLYKDGLTNRFSEILLDEKYKYYLMYNNSVLEILQDQTVQHQFVSVDKNNEVIGYISYGVNMACHYAQNLEIINFSNNKMLFGNDLKQAIKDMFEKHNYTKLCFSAIVDNPKTKTYKKLVEKYGGRIVGTYKNDVKLFTGEICDIIAFEIENKNVLAKVKEITSDSKDILLMTEAEMSKLYDLLGTTIGLFGGFVFGVEDELLTEFKKNVDVKAYVDDILYFVRKIEKIQKGEKNEE